MKKILYLPLLLLISCGLNNKESKLYSKIIKHCSNSLELIEPMMKRAYSEVKCGELNLKLLQDKDYSTTYGCSTNNHVCTEIRYNYELSINGNKYPDRLSYGLVTRAIDQVNKANKNKAYNNFFKDNDGN